MARKRKSPTYTSAHPSAVASGAARVSSALHLLRSLTSPPSLSLLELEDRRTWHPEGPTRPARASIRSASRIVPGSSYKSVIPRSMRFAVPEKVAICVRRGRRREVLFATRQTRRGSGSPKRRNWYSAISCRR